jgi:uncharacterized surface protein with fasciclin (FAS1) repeats
MKRIVSLMIVVMLLALALVPTVTAQDQPTIVEIALAVNADSGEFSTLIAAVSYAGLVDTLNGSRQFTVFAPTDAAFAKLGLNANNITNLPVDALTNILLYHVAPGERFSGDVVSSSRIRTMNKGFLFPSVTSDGAFVNSSKIIAVDIDASNGVIHIIDTVLIPG